MARSRSKQPETRTPSPPKQQQQQQQQQLPQQAVATLGSENKSKAQKRRDDYGSDGVEDNDVFLLPLSDYNVVIGVTILAAIVRLFRIYQPTSVVFDEVQYVLLSITIRYVSTS